LAASGRGANSAGTMASADAWARLIGSNDGDILKSACRPL
jgi:hypothetical protein